MSEATVVEWTEERCIKLIREFRATPSLWDRKDLLYYRKSTKAAKWDEIAKVFNVHSDECRRKMMILLSSFRREKARLMNSICLEKPDKPVINYTSIWFAFKEMAFLLDKEHSRKRPTKETATNDEEFEKIKMSLLKRHIQLDPKSIEKKHHKPSKAKRRPARVETLTAENTPSSSQALSDRDEEIKFFTSFIGNKMKNYTDVTKNAVQQAICKIIFKADQHFYETGLNSKLPETGKDANDKNYFSADCDYNLKDEQLTDSG